MVSLTLIERSAAAEYVIATPSEIAFKPQSLDYIQATAAPLSGLTAWQALFEQAHLSPEQSILIHGSFDQKHWSY
jgi:NADPH:quinone reductase-like Zn-dependent oxidoreductase